MNSSAELDGSDGQDRHTSTVDQRFSAFKDHLANAVLILESLDSSLLDRFKQDQACKDLVNRLLSAFPSIPLSRFASQIDQVVKSGLEGIVANIARISLLDDSPQEADRHVRQTIQSPGVPSLVSATPSTAQPSTGSKSWASLLAPLVAAQSSAAAARSPKSSSSYIPIGNVEEMSKEALKREATIHFLTGGYKGRPSQVINEIGQILYRVEEVRVLQSNRGNADGCLSLTSEPTSDSFPSMIKDLSLSSLWRAGTIARVREGGTVEYGFTIIGVNTNALFDLDPDLTQNRNQVYSDYLRSQPREPWGPNYIYVSETVAAGIYMLSGDTVRLEQLVADGEKSMAMEARRINRDVRRTNVYNCVITPFRLQY